MSHSPASPRAFTLVEMVMSLTILSIIVVAMGSAMTLMFRVSNSITAPTDPVSQSITSRAAVDQIVDDLKLALTVPERSATALTVTVPDRDGDGAPETIRYAWSGVAGAALTRQYNGGSAISIADNVRAFSLQHVLRTVGPPPPPPIVESAEQILAASDTTALIGSFGVKNSNTCSQYFQPSLPANTLRWKITRVKVQVQRNGNAGSNIQLAISAADASYRPTGASLDSGLIDLTTIGGGQVAWVEIPCTNLTSLTPGTGLCLVATASSGAVAYYVRYATLAVASPGYWTTIVNHGAWSTPNALQAMQFYVYGTVTTQQ